MDEKTARDYLESKGWGLIPPQTYIIDLESEFLKLWDRVKDFTMISLERAYALYQGLDYCCRNNISGDFVECGVWKGGASMLAALTLNRFNKEDKALWLYDTFEGMTQPGSEDIIAASGEAVSERNPEGWWAINLEEVRNNLFSTGYPQNNIHFVKGDVKETLNKSLPERISLLRLDTDWYASTRCELEVLFPRLEKGGVLLIDDYGHFKGARKAVDEYFEKMGIKPLLQRVDYTGRIWIKT